jgi:hypothetical protein
MSDKSNEFIDILKKEVGYAEKSDGYTKFGDWYHKQVEKDSTYKTAPWCDMFISWAADKAGVKDSVGQFAYTVSHAEWFKKKDAWSSKPAPGSIVFFDWDQTGEVGEIDHVGVVEKVNDGKVHTIEGNIDGGNLKKKVREDADIVGYGHPQKIAEKREAKSETREAKADGDVTGTAENTGTQTMTQSMGFVPAGDTMADPGQVVFSGLLVALLAMAYVTGVLAKARIPALVTAARGLPARVASTAPAMVRALSRVPAILMGRDPGLGTRLGRHRRRTDREG